MYIDICCLLSIEDDTNDVELKFTTYLHMYRTSKLRKMESLPNKML